MHQSVQHSGDFTDVLFKFQTDITVTATKQQPFHKDHTPVTSEQSIQ